MNILRRFMEWCNRVCFGLFRCTRDQPMYCASMVIIIVATLILVHFFYMSLFPIKTVKIEQVTIRTPVVHVGDVVEFELDWCSYGQYPVTIHRRLVDGFVYSLPEFETTTPPGGCYESIIRAVEVPESAPEGTYYIQTELIIHVNTIRDVIVSFESETFDVVK